MRTPFRSEAEAFAFLLVTVAAFAAIAVASLLGGAWAGVPVWASLTGAAAFFYLRRRGVRAVKTAPAHVGGEDERRLLVVVHDAVADEGLVREIQRASAGYESRVLVVCPERVSHADRWTSAVDRSRERAQHRLEESVSRLREAGIEAWGVVGDEDPLQAIEDALRLFGADEIIVAAASEAGDGATDHGVVSGARERYALPITHVVTDVAAVART